MDHDKLPFKIGQLAEAKSFQTGFRGAWFRCKIHDIDGSKGYIRHALEYIDFPDEKKKWTKIYQLPWCLKKMKGERQLMLRPQYPHRYDDIQIPAVNRVTEANASVDDVWKVGDLVDWWSDGCYWCARVTDLLGSNQAKITLLQSPEGEGGSYDVYCKDLRPTLDWSPEDGWRVPPLKNGDLCISFDRLVQQLKQGMENTNKVGVGLLSNNMHSLDEVAYDVEIKAGPEVNASLSAHILATSKPASDKSDPKKAGSLWQPLSIAVVNEVTETPEVNDLGLKRTSLAETAMHTEGKDFYNPAAPLKKLKIDGTFALNITSSGSLDAPILDLEELVNKLQWLKDIVDSGGDMSSDVRPLWQFVENRASSTQG